VRATVSVGGGRSPLSLGGYRMSTEFILFFVVLGVVLIYPLFSLIASCRLRALKTRLAADHCPKCREVFGPSIISTIRQFSGFIDPAPAGPVLRIVCPHCGVAWDYCSGSYTESSISYDAA
jgi:hypothetical protein